MAASGEPEVGYGLQALALGQAGQGLSTAPHTLSELGSRARCRREPSHTDLPSVQGKVVQSVGMGLILRLWKHIEEGQGHKGGDENNIIGYGGGTPGDECQGHHVSRCPGQSQQPQPRCPGRKDQSSSKAPRRPTGWPQQPPPRIHTLPAPQCGPWRTGFSANPRRWPLLWAYVLGSGVGEVGPPPPRAGVR